jgi:hypothetical protein
MGRRGRPPGGGNGAQPPPGNNPQPERRRPAGPISDQPWNPPVRYFRLLLTLANGAQAEVTRPTPVPVDFDDPDTAWLGLDIPLSILKFPAGQEVSPLSSITLGADGTTTVYVGQVNLVDDNSKIVCSAGPSQDVAAGDPTTFEARARGGASMLQYSWDFDATKAIIDEADGPVVSHAFPVGNKDYTVTLTVSDLDGIKQPCTSTVKIKVEE